MSGQWKGVWGASRALAQAVGVIASRWPAGDKISGPLDKESAWVDKISGDLDNKSVGSDKSGASSRAEEAEWTANLWQTLAGFAKI